MSVTDADREAAAKVAVLAEMRELILAGKADHHAEPWAAHREAAFNAGREAERAEVVRWLEDWIGKTFGADVSPDYLIRAIEAGEHHDQRAAC